VDAILMLHGWPGLGIGQIAVRSGPAMASSDSFSLEIEGRGGHAAYPHDTTDPILVGAQVITALQSIVAREMSPLAPAVVSVTTFHAGTARNIIPDKAELSGTVRTLDPGLRERMPATIERVIAGVCSALRARYAFRYTWGTPAVINDPGVTDLIRSVGRDLLGPENVIELTEPTMGAEDFAYYQQKVPGAMFRLGTGQQALLHTPRYDFGDAPLAHGIAVMVEATRRFLTVR
jgi:amidohydrolase